ncbi:MOSC domain-containing protein [soil metagenome]
MFTKAPFTGQVDALLVGENRAQGLEKGPVPEIGLTFAGIEGDFHAGLTRRADVRTIKQYPRNTEIRNVRQATILSAEELLEIAAAMGIPRVEAEWVGANLVTRGIPDLTLLPPSTRLQFPSGATLVVDLENAPCRQVSDVILGHYPDQATGFVKAALHRRGVTAWVEREGPVKQGDAIVVWVPPQRIYAHVAS